jgi:hypothetical protein
MAAYGKSIGGIYPARPRLSIGHTVFLMLGQMLDDNMWTLLI